MSEELSAAVVQAKQLIRDRDPEGSIHRLEAGLEQDPADGDAQELLGSLLFRLRRHEEARDAFRQLTRIDPRSAGAWVNLGAVQNVLGDFRAASESLRRAIQRDKDCAVAYYNLGIAQKGLDQPRLAVSAYQECVKRDPSCTDAWTNLGNLQMELTAYGKAVKAFESGLVQLPESQKLKRLLTRAQATVEDSRREESPFGRLVDEAELATRQTPVRRRRLSVHDRNRERETMRELSRSLRHVIRPMVAILDDTLPQKLHALHLAAATKDARGEGFAALSQLQESIEKLHELQATAGEATREIRSILQKTDPWIH